MKRYFAAFEQAGGSARIEIEDDGSRMIEFRGACEKDMFLDISQVSYPEQGRALVAKDIVNLAAIFAPRDSEGLDPRWLMLWRILFVERFGGYSIRIALESKWPVTEMWQNDVRGFRVESYHLTLGKA